MSKEKKKKKIISRRVFDSRGNPTIEVEIITNNNTVGRAMAPSGASTGASEAIELRDHEKNYNGKDITKALNLINNEISPFLLDLSVLQQEIFDEKIKTYDPTVNKSKIGGNVSIALSLANYICAANFKKIDLFEYCSKNKKYKIPNPEIQIFGGGAHAGNLSSFQDFLIYSPNKIKIDDFFEMTFNIFNSVKNNLKKDGLLKGYSDEGGFYPSSLNEYEICEYIINNIKKCGYEPGKDVAISIDVAATELFDGDKYNIQNKDYTSNDLLKIYKNLSENYFVHMIEDPFEQYDFYNFNRLKHNKGENPNVIADDLTCTNITLLKEAYNKNSIDGIIIKPNQCGTISETINVIKFCKEKKIKTILSARSGDTEENYLSHLAVGWQTDMIKVGSFTRSERMAKWNELLRIKEKLNFF